MYPKILVGCPTSFHKEYCLKQYAKAIKQLTYPNHDILLVDNSPDDSYIKKIKTYNLPAIKGPHFQGALDRIVTSRNILKEKALKDYDYLFSLEQDVIPPRDILERFLKHKKPLITGIYFNHNIMPDSSRKLIPLAYRLTDEKTLEMQPLNEIEYGSNQLIPVISAGLGCLLIHKSILEKVKFRHENGPAFDDRFFFIDCYKQKIQPYADTSLKCRHLILNRPHPWHKIKK